MADDNLRQDLVDQVREEQHKRKHAPRVHRVPRADTPAGNTAQPTGSDTDGAEAPEGGDADNGAPRKRRRRRRPGGGQGTGPAGGGGIPNS